MKLNVLIWIIFYGIMHHSLLFSCEAEASKNSSAETYNETQTKIDSMIVKIKDLENQSKDSSLNPLVKIKIIAKKNNLLSLLHVINTDRANAVTKKQPQTTTYYKKRGYSF